MFRKIQHFLSANFHQDIFFRAILSAFLLSVVFSLLPFFVSCNEISNEIIRLHVIANSDSAEDQALKLKIRDRVLTEAAKWYGDAENFEEANAALCMRLESIQKAAEDTARENGVFAPVTATMSDAYFTTREYTDFTLPAGKYRTLKIVIGAGNGKNWWCMAYPSLCLPAAEKKSTDKDLLAILPDHETRIITNPKDYTVKFKIVELFEKLKDSLDKR